MFLYDYLRQMREDIPAWLNDFEIGNPFLREQFFASRVVYYPGAGTDGHPVKLFGSTHSAHCFVYADYGIDQPAREAELGSVRGGVRGYNTLARLQLREQDLVPEGWIPHVHAGEVPLGENHFAPVAAAPFGFLEVLERDPKYDDNHGARRLAILFLGADGIAAFDALFCQGRGISPPFAVLLQDHGFGGNYDRFGADGLLERIATRCNVVPRWLLVADNTDPWRGFDRVPGVGGDPGGMHGHVRFLYERRGVLNMPYDLFTHRHNFAVWAAARAAQRGFTTVQNLKEALEASGVQRFLPDPAFLDISCDRFGQLHTIWCKAIVASLEARSIQNVSYGRAAKLLAVYLKSMVIAGGDAYAPIARCIHPPIDRRLLQALARDERYRNVVMRDQREIINWTQLDEDRYFDLIGQLREKLPSELPFWMLEEYWTVTDETVKDEEE